jgi:hypothetical protein
MDVHDLTPAGRVRIEELRERYRKPARWALRRSWPVAERWIFYAVVPVAVGLLWLIFGG